MKKIINRPLKTPEAPQGVMFLTSLPHHHCFLFFKYLLHPASYQGTNLDFITKRCVSAYVCVEFVFLPPNPLCLQGSVVSHDCLQTPSVTPPLSPLKDAVHNTIHWMTLYTDCHFRAQLLIIIISSSFFFVASFQNIDLKRAWKTKLTQTRATKPLETSEVLNCSLITLA